MGDNLTIWFTFARAAQFASCLLILGIYIFDRSVIGNDLPRESDPLNQAWRKIAARLLWPAVLTAALSGVAWFVLVAMVMSDLPLGQAVKPHILRLVWSHTQFGRLWQLRWICYVVTTVLIAANRYSKIFAKSVVIWLTAISAATLLGSLAWSGHGRDGSPPQLHLAADVLHLIVAAAWPAGLLPFGLVLLFLRQLASHEAAPYLIIITRRFSAMSLVSVAILAATGVINSCFLLHSISSLFLTSYGHVLLVKLALFLVMVALGAVNLLYLKPRLAGDESKVSRKLQLTVGMEIICGTVVVVVVALLGTLPPG